MAQDHSNSLTSFDKLPSEGSFPYETTEIHPFKAGNTRRASQSLELLNENSPLLEPQRVHDGLPSRDQGLSPVGALDWNEGDGEETKSIWYLFLLTLSIGGLQIAWTVEISNGSPYLLSLGMSKELLAFVWIAGPLTGVLVQPYIGIRSDNCRVSWGKRKPFMLAGAAATILSLLALAWTREIVGGLLSLFGTSPDSQGVKITSIVFAIVVVYVLDFAINAVQAGIRAFIVDNAPTHQQEAANAWAGRITGFGNILGYLSSYVNLPRIMPFFGDTQFKVLCVIAAFALGGTVIVSCLAIRERDPRLEGPAPAKIGVLSFFRQIMNSMRRLPPQVRKVCEVQFFNWMGWFPFLFYITTYIGQLYVNPIFAANPDLTPAEVDRTWEEATRVGSFALLIFAITSFASNILLPFIVVPSYRPVRPAESTSAPYYSSQYNHPSTPGTPGMSGSMTSFFPPTPSPESHSRVTRILSICQIPWLTLRRAWILSHLLYALCMGLTFFVSTPFAATILVGVIGLAWALTLWAPFALISAEISKRDALQRMERRSTDNGEPIDDKGTESQAGVVLGLHNVAVSAPQIISTLVSSAIFRLAQKPRGSPWDDSVGWVLRFGGCAALVAAYMTSRVGEEGDKMDDDDDDEQRV